MERVLSYLLSSHPQQPVGVVGLSYSFSFSLLLSQDYQIQLFEKEMEMSKAQSDAGESRKLLGVGEGRGGFMRHIGQAGRWEGREELMVNTQVQNNLWAPSACGLCRSLTPILSSAQVLRSHDCPRVGTL